jgi:hypothetical protein
MAPVQSTKSVSIFIYKLIKTECGRSKYIELASRKGIAARLRLSWFVLIAAIRDLRLTQDQL